MSFARVLLIGASGQVGWRLAHRLGTRAIPLTRAQCDLSTLDADAATRLLGQHKPDMIINAAGFTAVDAAEEQRELAMRVNAEGPGILAREAAAADIPFIQLSTDYIFEGVRGAPYVEDSAANPQNHYGASKLRGELAVLEAGGKPIILRLQWIYDKRGTNFFLTMRKLLAERSAISVVADQFGAPTSAHSVASAIVAMLPLIARGMLASGIYHLTSAGQTSWQGFTVAIAEELRRRDTPLACEIITPITTAEYVTPATRPHDTRLDCGKLAAHGITLPHWRESFAALMEEIDAYR